jgi:DeoR/GlpR family transcriptional regulator of sugar metabolism
MISASNIAAELAWSDFEIILIGGTLRKNSVSVVGPAEGGAVRWEAAQV